MLKGFGGLVAGWLLQRNWGRWGLVLLVLMGCLVVWDGVAILMGLGVILG